MRRAKDWAGTFALEENGVESSRRQDKAAGRIRNPGPSMSKFASKDFTKSRNTGKRVTRRDLFIFKSST
jgi:hypothetical protein